MQVSSRKESLNLRKSLPWLLMLNSQKPGRFSFEDPYQPGLPIPKIIHQTGGWNYDELPELIKKNIEDLRQRNPDWEYRYYNDKQVEEFIESHCGREVVDMFHRIDRSFGPARADLFRYLLLYKVGGVYLDIKSTATLPLTQVLLPDDQFILSHWDDNFPNLPVSASRDRRLGFLVFSSPDGAHAELSHMQHGEFVQWFIVSARSHPFLKYVIEAVLGNIEDYNPVFHGYGKQGVFRVTGPIAYTLAIAPILHLYPYRYASSQKDMGFRYSIVSGGGFMGSAHAGIFRKHYTTLRSSVIRLGPFKSAIALIFEPFRYLMAVVIRRKR